MIDDMGAPADADKRTLILDSALAKFSAYGFARTSMADIASGAGMSRPALYQYYANKEEIFREMLGRILDEAADRAIAALETDGPLVAQLDGFLQRWTGDLLEQLRSTEHGADLIEAKTGHAKPVADVVHKRVHDALHVHLRTQAPDRAETLTEMVLLSPIGLKADNPSMAKLRRRLTALAEAVAASAQG